MRLLRGVRREGGYTMVEMVTVMVILSVVMTGITTVFVQGSNAEIDMNNRFQAQTNARVGLDKVRKDIHCASAVPTPVNQTDTWVSSITLTTSCIAGATSVSFCAVTVGGNTGLYRQVGAACGSASPAIRIIDRLTSTSVFMYQAPFSGSLAMMWVKLPVNTATAKHLGSSTDTYTLCSGVLLRNGLRAGTGHFPAAPCG